MPRKPWVIQPSKTSAKVPDAIKRELQERASEVIENILKPKHVKAPRENEEFNFVSDISAKWYRHYFYFIATYTCPASNALTPSFESKFARLEYLGGSKFAMYFMRHNGEWVGVYDDLSVDECLKAVQEDSWFHP